MRIDISHQTRHTPPNMLPREQNCVAMALSACFRQQLNPVVNSLLKERIIHSPKELEHDNAVIRVLQKLQIQEVCNSTLWETAKQQLLQKSDGRYFAINSKHLAFPGPGES
ncbi:hypothetical protein, partial [Shigella sp. FC6509]